MGNYIQDAEDSMQVPKGDPAKESEMNYLLDQLDQLRIAAGQVVKEWGHHGPRLTESRENDDPRVLAVQGAIDRLEEVL